MWKISFFFLFLSFLFQTQTQLSGSIPCGESFGMTFLYEINDGMICFTASINQTVWIGIAVGNLTLYKQADSANWMYGADYAIGQLNDSIFGVSDYYLIQPKVQQMPVLDTEQGCPNNLGVPPLSSSQIDGVTTISFCRLLNTGDGKCDNIIFQASQTNYFLCAAGKSNTFQYHGADRRDFVDFQFPSAVEKYTFN